MLKLILQTGIGLQENLHLKNLQLQLRSIKYMRDFLIMAFFIYLTYRFKPRLIVSTSDLIHNKFTFYSHCCSIFFILHKTKNF